MPVIRRVDVNYCFKLKYNTTKCGGKRLSLKNDK